MLILTELKHSSLELIVSLFHQMYAYAETVEIVDKDYSAHVKINIPEDDISGIPFTDEELCILWEHKENPIIEFILIMCYDCRHTFSYLCEKFKVNKNDRKRMLGHSFGNDITNKIYGHRTVEELRKEIEKIQL